MSDRHKWSLWGGLLLVWIGLVAVNILAEPEPRRVPLTYQSGPALSRGTPHGSGEFTIRARPQAKATPAVFREPKNIFAPFGRSRVPAPKASPIAQTAKKQPSPPAPVQGPPPPTPEELAARQAVKNQELAAQQAIREQELAVQRARQQQEQMLQGARQQLAQYRFLGFMQRGDGAQVFLGKGQDIYIVRAGETLDGRIQVKGVDQTSVQLLDAPTKLETTLQLTKGPGAF